MVQSNHKDKYNRNPHMYHHFDMQIVRYNTIVQLEL